MHTLGKYSLLLVSFCLFIAGPVTAQDDEFVPPDIDPIDIYAMETGDFLNIDIDELATAGWMAYSDGDYESAAAYYLTYLTYNSTDGSNLYNLACCYGLLGEAELAAYYLEFAVKAGFTEMEWAGSDPDFDAVREADVFSQKYDELVQWVGDQEGDTGDIHYTMAPTFMHCNIMVPEGFDPNETYTLVVGLHGFGSNPDRFVGLWERFDNPQFIWATPRAPYAFSSGGDDLGFSWNHWDERSEGLWQRTQRWSQNYVVQVVEDLTAQYNVDEVYLMGFSQGCMMAYTTGIQNHELFDGLICFGGWLDNEWLSDEEIGAANDLRVFIAHGNEDMVVEFESGTVAMEYLVGFGYDVTFFEFDGAHAVPENACLAFQDWIDG